MKQVFRVPAIFCIFILLAGCATTQQDTITQYSFIDAILAGAYDGQEKCSKILEHGDMGIGTFDGLDGEMVVLDRQIYQVKYDGSVVTPGPEETTPFACVTEFLPDKAVNIVPGTDLKGLMHVTDLAAPNQNIFLALKATGTFSMMLTRSVPEQTKPYPPLVEVTKNQSQFHMKNVKGTVVGFRTPPYAKGIGVPGYHLHFLSDDKQQGGHILDLTFEKGAVEIDLCNRFVLINPKDESGLKDMDFSKDRTHELEQAEKKRQ
ncbi:acetolactate decarboxylase [Desulfatibacillum alkenivorans DSM 16219]|jgi:acetolactate decarboxylase|uniref:Alpha-acetolactate decarboxylase n=1 Tax=Desulfatibacillum alkenivorans DSM 16219 TaxID=1121393 RepID=A0A1M6MQY4_9BACT|nr:acetolactate decarboxylase [Desulfatibacillum alkenivorans]SHJ85806.1 acetolactate decarboxylase [Desulfatibacillum alkenivorans DSM 16219]